MTKISNIVSLFSAAIILVVGILLLTGFIAMPQTNLRIIFGVVTIVYALVRFATLYTNYKAPVKRLDSGGDQKYIKNL